MKKIALILIILFATGCNIKYDLTITDKQKVNEKFYVYVDNSKILESYSTIDEYLDYYSNIYKENLTNNSYLIKTKKSKPQSYFIVSNSYKNLSEYVNSTSFLSMFNSADIEQVGKYTMFTTSTNSYLESIKNDTLLSEEDLNTKFSIRIKFYNEVVSSNADSVDKKNNIYTWNVDANTTKENIYFKIGPKVKYNVVIMDYIQNNIISILVIGISLILIILLCIYIYIKSKKNNEV